MKSETLSKNVRESILNGERYSEEQALVTLLEISSEQAVEGKYVTGEELIDKLNKEEK